MRTATTTNNRPTARIFCRCSGTRRPAWWNGVGWTCFGCGQTNFDASGLPAQCDKCDQPTAAHHANRITMQFCIDGTPEGVWQCQSCGGMTSGTTQ